MKYFVKRGRDEARSRHEVRRFGPTGWWDGWQCSALFPHVTFEVVWRGLILLKLIWVLYWSDSNDVQVSPRLLWCMRKITNLLFPG